MTAALTPASAGRSQSPNAIVGSATARAIELATQEWSGGVGAGRVLCGERDRQLGDDRCRDASACLEARHRTMISSNDRELPLVLCESRVTGLVRPVYKDDGSGSSRDGVVVQASPAGGLLPIWRRPIRGRHQIGSGCSPGPDQSRTQEKQPKNGSSPTTPMQGPRRSDATGTKRVHQYPRGRTLAVELDPELPVITGDRSPLSAYHAPPALDRTQEVAGSSPASSISEARDSAGGFCLAGRASGP